MKSKHLGIEDKLTALLATTLMGLFAACMACWMVWVAIEGNNLWAGVCFGFSAYVAYRMGRATYGLLQLPCINFGDDELKVAADESKAA